VSRGAALLAVAMAFLLGSWDSPSQIASATEPAPASSTLLAPPTEDATLSVVTSVQAVADAYGKHDSNLDSSHALAKASGTESSQCMPYGRAGLSNGAADATWTSRGPNWVAVNLAVSADAKGGHYRTCSFCAANECVGIHGNDTKSRASGTARSILTIAFDPKNPRPSDYVLTIAPSVLAKGLTAMLSGPDGATRTVDLAKGEEPILVGKQGAIYHLTVSLAGDSADEGGCCSDNSALASFVDVRIKRAPLLTAGAYTGYIVGGTQTPGYKNVGAILLDGKPHCTGTLIGPRTVLTAAHCLYGFEAQKTTMTFVLCSNVQYPDQGPVAIDDWKYPDGSTPGFKFDSQNLEDDIGIIHLKQPLAVTTARLYDGAPTWENVRDDGLSLLFVGFGYNSLDGSHFGVGIKREGSWKISSVTNRTVSFSVPGKSTCHGDSGGPAFIERQSQLYLAAVTSGGDDNCTKGVETRIDAYRSWLDSLIT
jgi:secreted trypsin-like serine protease